MRPVQKSQLFFSARASLSPDFALPQVKAVDTKRRWLRFHPGFPLKLPREGSMKPCSRRLALVVCLLVGSFGAVAAQTPVADAGAAVPGLQPASVIPQFVKLAGTLLDLNGKPLTGIVGVTFALYVDQQGGAPLWLETQNMRADSNGHHSVMLGSTTAEGLPADVFSSGDARWLGAQPAGQPEQARVMLLSVPYALKAGDAQTLGGLLASAFMLSVPTPSAQTSGRETATQLHPAYSDDTLGCNHDHS